MLTQRQYIANTTLTVDIVLTFFVAIILSFSWCFSNCLNHSLKFLKYLKFTFDCIPIKYITLIHNYDHLIQLDVKVSGWD